MTVPLFPFCVILMTYVLKSRYPPDSAPILALIRSWAWAWGTVALVVWVLIEGVLWWRQRD